MRQFTNTRATFDEFEVFTMDTCGGPVAVILQNDAEGLIAEIEIDFASLPEVMAKLAKLASRPANQPR